MIVSMDKKYTLEGEPYTLLTTTLPGSNPVVGHDAEGRISLFNPEGRRAWSDSGSSNCLVEVSPYADFVIDEPVMVRDYDDHKWRKAHFSGVVDSHPSAFFSGFTKWSSNGQAASWLQCRRPTAEELSA